MEGKIADKIVFEDDRIRVWELDLEPGESTEKHTHENDYLFYVYSPSKLQVTHCDDGSEEIIDTHQGQCLYFDAGDTHYGKNIGDKPFKEILIEFKK